MRITTLIENTLGENIALTKEHGLSIFIETPEGSILFDTGQSGNFISNAEKLNIDLNKIDYIVLSHAHYDHAGGVKPLLEFIQAKPKLYVSKHFFSHSERYHVSHSEESSSKYIGIDFNENNILEKDILINYVCEDFLPITSKISIATNFYRDCSFEPINNAMKVNSNNTLCIDTFKDEIAIAIDTSEGLLVLVGCSHPGIVNIINTIRKRSYKKIYGVIGGTHLIEADDSRVDKTIKYFKDLNIKLIGLSHCTGKKAAEKFKQETPNFFINYTGKSIEIK
ncbi:MBL fold metallo-hydrolase [Clostridium bovifaecis]|uniref:MBL fold metallo-hydrolase n=1 Tax=Clostridium bovifaecis TaxID=2184719 RepID=A0A6I6F386_9CLOT|nr:MBL fold metallo-hydrolase [Clostridium bovifaecis]